MIRQVELVEKVMSYDPTADENALNRAYVFAMKAHGAQVRASGDPYFSHPLEVAAILADYKLDSASIITALLHDTIEDTPATSGDIKNIFGEEVWRLVDGVTKLTRIELQSDASRQAENFRKLVLAMSEDIRVLLVKLADRLHNMRTIDHLKPEKRRRIAIETMEIYAPLAERIGMQEIKSELEDRSFSVLNPEARSSITARLEFLREEENNLIDMILDEITEFMKEAGISATITGREKSPYSVWRKMRRQDVGFEQLSDIMAFRVIVESTDDAYRSLGVIHSAYSVVPRRFKDYISTPKSNGYRSIHTDVLGPGKQRIEIQIRTREMHEVAERGVAAHWVYKQNPNKPEHSGQYRWLRELLDILEHAANPDDFLEHTKLEMYQDQVFCFTPKGEVINLPTGATPVDFAYAVHSEVGDLCVGATINGRMMPLRTRLNNGDQVRIVTSKAQTPSPTWERFVVTGKAKARIRRFIRLREKEQYVELGRQILDKAFSDEGHEYSQKALDEVAGVFKQSDAEDLVAKVGAGVLSGRAVVEAVFPGAKRNRMVEKVVSLARARKRRAKRKNSGKAIPIKGLIPGMAVHFAGCCHPLPGDRIVGIIQSGKGITIHAIDCDLLQRYSDQPERWIDVSWDSEGHLEETHVGRMEITIINNPGGLGTLSTVIAKNNGSISNLKITGRYPDFFDLIIDVEVRNVRHLTDIMAALRATPVINSVERARG